MEDRKADVLVISPHPDDAEFGAAGSVAGFVQDGKSVVYVICTNGDKGTDDIRVKPEDLAQIRELEQLAAAEVLGVRKVSRTLRNSGKRSSVRSGHSSRILSSPPILTADTSGTETTGSSDEWSWMLFFLTREMYGLILT
jgi:hypothetical protein